MSDNWFAHKLAPDGDVQDGCHPEEAQALKLYLHRNTTAMNAADAVTRPIIAAENPKEDLPRLWALLIDALIELPGQHTEPLIALLQAIEGLPIPTLTAVTSNQPSERLWRSLPNFGHLWSDMYRTGNWRFIIETMSGSERVALRYEKVRQAEIEARIVAAGLAHIPIDWGYETVADALESRNAVLDVEIPAAAQWMVVCGSRFRHGAEKREKSWALKPRCAELTVKALVDQEMNLERWGCWRERLECLHTESVTVKDAARKALYAMYEEEKISFVLQERAKTGDQG